MAVELNTFFRAIAERHQESHHKENHLSDMTYALCQSDEAFKQFFLDFFFGNGKINVCRDKVEITRELSFDEGRPDFSIYVGDDDIYLVEVKIWDGQHHFSQYMDILEREHKCKADVEGHLGYITNYKINVTDLSEDDKKAYEIVCAHGKTVRTWKEFVRGLEGYKNFNDPVIGGYVQYIRDICPFDDFELAVSSIIKLIDFRDVSYFVNSLADTILGMSEKGVFPYTRSSKYFASQERMGHFFELRNFEDEKSAWGWVGANYTQKGAVVFVEFENRDGWGKPVCELFKSLPFNVDLRFYLKDKSMEWKTFFEQVIYFVKAKGELPCPPSISLTIDGATRIESLLVMKSLPWLMDRFFLASANKQLSEFSGWTVSSVDTEHGDSEKQNSHCGRYFILDHEGQRFIEFWLGALFNETLRTKSGDKFSDQPKILFDISIEDYEYLLSFSQNQTGWYKIREWERAVQEIVLAQGGSQFGDIVDRVVEVLKSIIHGYAQSNKCSQSNQEFQS